MALQSKISASGRLSFYCLPQEIRDEIYRLALMKKIKKYRSQNIRLRPRSPKLARTLDIDVVELFLVSKQVYQEARLVYYAQNAFRIYIGAHGPSIAFLHLTKFRRTLAWIRDLELRVDMRDLFSNPLVALADTWQKQRAISGLSLIVNTLSASLSNPNRFLSGYTYSEAEQQFVRVLAPLWRIQGIKTVEWRLIPDNTTRSDYDQGFKRFEKQYLQDLSKWMMEKP
jgi:hypothetical protein